MGACVAVITSYAGRQEVHKRGTCRARLAPSAVPLGLRNADPGHYRVPEKKSLTSKKAIERPN